MKIYRDPVTQQRLRDHPRCRSPKGVMSCDEIRFWIKWLREVHGWKTALDKVSGALMGAAHGKLLRCWIFPGEQIRFTRAIERILAGEVVVENKQPVEAANPVPLRQPSRWRYDLQAGRLLRVPPVTVQRRQPAMPSFRGVMENPRTWDPNPLRVPARRPGE